MTTITETTKAFVEFSTGAGGLTNAMVIGMEGVAAHDAYLSIQPVLATGRVTGSVARSISADVSIIVGNNSSLEGIKLSSLAQNSMRIVGAVGSTIVLACDTAVLAERVASYRTITKELKETAKDSMKYTVLQDMQKRMGILIASSVCAVTMDTLETAISLGAPVVGLPVHIVSFAVALARLYGEQVVDKETRKKLEKTVKAFEESNKDVLKDVEAFKHTHAALKANLKAAKTKKEKTAEALEKANSGLRSGSPISRAKQGELQKLDVEAEDSVKSAAEAFEKSEKTMANLEAYELAKTLIEELHPLLAKKAHLERHIESFHTSHKKIHGERFLKSPPSGVSFDHSSFEGHLHKELVPLQKQLDEVSREKRDVNDRIERVKHNLESPLDHYDFSRAEDFAYRKSLRHELERLENKKHSLKFEKAHLRKEIAKMEQEVHSLKKYQKSTAALIDVNKKIERRKLKKETAHTKRKTSLPSLKIDHSRLTDLRLNPDYSPLGMIPAASTETGTPPSAESETPSDPRSSSRTLSPFSVFSPLTPPSAEDFHTQQPLGHNIYNIW